MNHKVIDKAVRCRSFGEFRRRYVKDYLNLLRLGQAKELLEMFENGTIDSMRPPEKPTPVVRKEKGPRVHLEDIMKAVKLYRTFAGFMRRSRGYADAVRRRGLEDEVKGWFDRDLRTEEVLQESEAFSDWESFEIDRPRYADAAVKHRVKDLIIREMEARNERAA